jgi:hypothetical protein
MMDPHALFEPPFTGLSDQGVVGVPWEQAEKFVQVIQPINANALVASRLLQEEVENAEHTWRPSGGRWHNT